MKLQGPTPISNQVKPMVTDLDAARIIRVMKARAVEGHADAATVCLMVNFGLLSKPVPSIMC